MINFLVLVCLALSAASAYFLLAVIWASGRRKVMIFRSFLSFLGMVCVSLYAGSLLSSSTEAGDLPHDREDIEMRPMIAGENDVSERQSDLASSKQCAALLDPLWREYKAFKNDAEFKRVGFSQGFPYYSWMEKALDLRDNLNDPQKSDIERVQESPCGRPDIAHLPGAPSILTMSPLPYDLISAAKSVFRDPSPLKTSGEQKEREIDAFMTWMREGQER